MSEQTTAPAVDHPLKDFKPTTKTIWHHQAERPGHCEVNSLKPPPQEISLRESCGRQHVKGVDPQYAAQVYRATRKLPEDWPVEVDVCVRQEDGTFKTTETVRLPAPAPAVPEAPAEPKAPQPAEAALDVDGHTATEEHDETAQDSNA